MAAETITIEDIKAAYERIKSTVKRTPVFEDDEFNEEHGRKFYFKAENMQQTGAFKIRGVLNAVLKLKENGTEIKGLVTHSSGNHGRALAWVARKLRLPCVIACPTFVIESKLRDMRNLGAEILTCPSTPTDRLNTALKVKEERGYQFISTSDDYGVIAGQGTIALELLEQVPDLDAILVPISGGGMASGICVAAKALKPDIKVFTVEPAGKDLGRCLIAGERLWPDTPQCLDTIADGMRTQQVSHTAWPIILKHAEKHVFSVKDDEAIEGMKYAFNNLKVVVEPSAGTSIAAAMSRDLAKVIPESKRVGVILCGGNVDISNLPF